MAVKAATQLKAAALALLADTGPDYDIDPSEVRGLLDDIVDSVPSLGLRKIYSGAQTAAGSDRTGAPLDGATATLVLPSAPNVMMVRAGWRLYRTFRGDQVVDTEGYSEGLYAGGDTHVRAHFGNVNWAEFENIGLLSAESPAVSVGLLSDDLSYTNAFTLEYKPSARTLSFAAVNDPVSPRIPVVHSLIVAGS